MGLPNEEATAPGSPFSNCVENWITPIFTPGRGVTLPPKRASMINGRDGCGEIVAVAEAAGVAVRMKLVDSTVAVFDGAGVCVDSGPGSGDCAPAKDRLGGWIGVKRLTMSSEIPVSTRKPVSANPRRARILFCWRMR